jgi:nucleoside phosphorylase
MNRPIPRLLVQAVALGAAVLLGRTGAAQTPPARFGDGCCAITEATCGAPPALAVFSAFPAELQPLVERATVRETLVIGDRVLRVGTLGDVPVVLGLLGIGLENAASTTRLVLDHFDVAAFVVSGVAGSPQRIGDVTVPDTWTEDDGASHPADPALTAIAREVAASGVAFEKCTPVPPEPPGPTVCLGYDPQIVVGGSGHSSDPFGGNPVRCTPGGGDVFGCDVTAAMPASAAPAGGPGETNLEVETTDMETAAAAREAQARGVPFIAFRAVSDGAGDPLGLPGFPAQFFAYYRLAADNVAAATAAFVARWGEGRKFHDAAKSRPAAVRASCDWERLATAACSVRRHAPRTVRATVDRTCRLLASDAVDDAAVARTWQRAARLAGKATARQRLGRACAHALSAALLERASQ